MPLRAVQKLISRRFNEKNYTRQRATSTLFHGERESDASHSLRLLSFNIQVGITTQQYGHYVTRGWQHLLPSFERQSNLDRIARLIHSYDVVAIQEADGGSLRSGFVNQIEYLAHRAGFPWWYQQLNRNLGRLAQHSNGLLTRIHPENLEDHKLPGLIPGRGAIAAEFGAEKSLLLIVMHLALSQRGRNTQLEYIRKLAEDYEHIVLMGDMNAHADQLLDNSPLAGMGLHSASRDVNTFPSWKPSKSLDHILLSSELHAQSFSVVDFPQSDHLPVAVQIELPPGMEISRNIPTTH